MSWRRQTGPPALAGKLCQSRGPDAKLEPGAFARLDKRIKAGWCLRQAAFRGLIDDLGGDLRRLLFVKRRHKQLGVFHAQLQRPGPQRAVRSVRQPVRLQAVRRRARASLDTLP